MTKQHLSFILVVALLAAFFSTSADSDRAFAWSNGGYSSDPFNPGYGTHDWIAQHALGWLPASEKQFITDNLAWYLYGTELPDNGQAQGGVGDTTKHHVYFFANGSLQDDAAAVRAREEYVKAEQAFGSGNLSDSAMHLGMVSHYVADVAVFGHVMGAATAWGAETHHSDYENYVLGRTQSYQDEFNSYLVYDGSLSSVSAYDTALAVARNTTFSANGNCTWMDQHYSWSDTTFRNRTGESLSIAANAVADVLHTFFTERVIPEFPSTAVFFVLALVVSVLFVYFRKAWIDKTLQ